MPLVSGGHPGETFPIWDSEKSWAYPGSPVSTPPSFCLFDSLTVGGFPPKNPVSQQEKNEIIHKEKATGVRPTGASADALGKLQDRWWLTSRERIPSLLLTIGLTTENILTLTI